jgi:hypothetical protein
MQVLDAREINYCGKYQRLASDSILNAYKKNKPQNDPNFLVHALWS